MLLRFLRGQLLPPHRWSLDGPASPHNTPSSSSCAPPQPSHAGQHFVQPADDTPSKLTTTITTTTLTTATTTASCSPSSQTPMPPSLSLSLSPSFSWRDAAINLGALLFLLPFLVLSFFPVATPLRAAASMNWGSAIYAGVLATSAAYYAAHGRQRYMPPVALVVR
jgi:hypothetical protein